MLFSLLDKPLNPFDGLGVDRKPANDRFASRELFSYSNAPVVPLADLPAISRISDSSGIFYLESISFWISARRDAPVEPILPSSSAS